MHDQFIQDQFRLTLFGTSIGVDIETSPITAKLTDLAGSLVRSYTARLSHALGETLQLLTEQEFANLPPWASSNVAMTFSGMEHRPSFDYKQIADILRQVRHDTITYGWPLKACYDYMQTALAAQERFFFDIYKMVETMGSHYGGEAALKAKSGLAHEVKLLKRLANEASLDQRHAPQGGATPGAPNSVQRGEAHECAQRLLTRFEELCRLEGLAS